ncbi:MAG: hypothetical protein K5761_04465 [Clostridiales bacterium]|nr:hypothetical protein [Clostridiales bacterium]
MNNTLKGILGLCRRAGKISVGHDAARDSVKRSRACLVICCSDASQRLIREMSEECSYNGRSISFVCAPFDKKDLSIAIGVSAAVISVDDAGFAGKIYSEMTGGNINGIGSKEV